MNYGLEALILFALSMFVLYVVIRVAVKAGIEDADAARLRRRGESEGPSDA